MRYEAVVFDVDGTLLDSVPVITRAVNSVISDIGMSARTEEQIRKAVGYGIEELLRRIGVPGVWTGPLKDQVASEYRRAGWSSAELYSHASVLLNEVRRRNMGMAVLSNRPAEAVVRSVEYHLPEYPFKAVVGSVGNTPAKPGPEALLDVCSRLGVSPGKAVLVGDGEADVLAAAAAGTGHTGVLWGYCSREQLAAAGAVNLAETAEEALEFIFSKE